MEFQQVADRGAAHNGGTWEDAWAGRARRFAGVALASGTGEDVAALMAVAPRTRWRWNKKVTSAILAAFAAVLVGIWGWLAWQVPPGQALVMGEETTTAPPSPSASPTSVTVYVSGAVNTPGVYTAESGARTEAFIELAGGLTQEADASGVNLAAPVVDGAHIVVPALNESAQTDGGSTAPTKININSASAETLDALPGIGPSLAAAIVSWREENGPFTSVDDLVNVPGIGESKLAQLRDSATI